MLCDIVEKYQVLYITRLIAAATRMYRFCLEYRLERGLPLWDGKQTTVNQKSLTILENLGTGSYGSVSLVLYKRKRIAYKQFDEPDCQSSFRELYALSSLNHPSIIPLAGLVRNTKGVITGYLMPLASRSLMDLIHITPPPSHRSTQITNLLDNIGNDITQGIAHLHQNAFLHRDIKPDNVLLVDGRACVSDFGLATIIPEGPCINTGEVHTAFFRAPELWSLSSEQATYGPEIDIYALGMTLTYMYSGTSTLSESGLLIRRAQKTEHPYKLVRSIHRTLDSFHNVPSKLLRLMTDYSAKIRPGALEVTRKWKALTKYNVLKLNSKAGTAYKKGIHHRLSEAPTKFIHKCNGANNEVSRESYMIAHLRSRKPKLNLDCLTQIASQLVTYEGIKPDRNTWEVMFALCKQGSHQKHSKEKQFYASDLEKYIHLRTLDPHKRNFRR
mgnify:CR=1 FL=1